MTPLVSFFMAAWAPLALGMLLGVIVLSYRIERRSPDLSNRSGLPRMAMLFHTVSNLGVARDGQTQSMRRIMLALLAGIVLLFVAVGIVVSGIEGSS